MYYRIGKDGARYWGKKGAGILFTDGSKILLLKRSLGDNKGTWGIPGGKAKEDESEINNAKRESKEEAGHVEGVRFARFDEKDGQHRFTVFLYKTTPFRVTLSNEHSDSKWIPIDELEQYKLHPKFQKGLPYYLKAIKKEFPSSFSEWLSFR